MDRPHIRVIPEWFGGGTLPRTELHEAAEQLTANQAGLIAVGEPSIEKGLDKAFTGAARVVKRAVEATTDEITSELQEALKEADMVDMHLEVDIIPVSDVDRAKQFYQRLGWRLDADDIWHGPPFPVEARQPGPDPEHTSYGSFCSFNDPDDNTWLVQEVTTRRPGV